MSDCSNTECPLTLPILPSHTGSSTEGHISLGAPTFAGTGYQELSKPQPLPLFSFRRPAATIDIQASLDCGFGPQVLPSSITNPVLRLTERYVGRNISCVDIRSRGKFPS